MAASLPLWLITSPLVILFSSFLSSVELLFSLCQSFASSDSLHPKVFFSHPSFRRLLLFPLHRCAVLPVGRTPEWKSVDCEKLFPSKPSPSVGGALPVALLDIKASTIHHLYRTDRLVSTYFSDFLPDCTIRRRCVTQRGLEISRAGELDRALIVETSADSSLSSETTNVEAKKKHMKYSFSVSPIVSL